MEIYGLLVPFTGEFVSENEEHVAKFSIEEGTGYGLVRYDNYAGQECYYCYMGQNNSGTIYEMHGGGIEGRSINYTLDQQGNCTSVTINNITYEPAT